MAYVQANILLSATYVSPRAKEELFEQAWSFQESLENGYKKTTNNPTPYIRISAKSCRCAVNLLQGHLERQGSVWPGDRELGGGKLRQPQFQHRYLDPTTSGVADGKSAPVDPAPVSPHLEPPVPVGESLPSSPGAGAGRKAKKKKQ